MVTYPNDWGVDAIVKVADIKTGCRDTQNNISNGRYPFFVRSPIVERIDVADFDCEAVLTAGDGVGTGKVFHYINGKFAAHQRVYVMNNFRGVDGKYFYYYFSNNFRQEVEKYTAKSSVDSVRRDMIAKMDFPHPSLPEQKEIVKVLSDFDEHIDNLTEWIEKKKAIRDGALEDLVSGRTRVDGFDDEWENDKLGDILGYTQPIKYIENNYNEKGKVPVLTAGKSFILGYSNKVDNAYINLPTILFDDFTTEVRYIDYPFMVKSSATKFLNLKNNQFDIKFLYYWLIRLNYKIEAHERHWISRFSKFYAKFPDFKEQQAIAEILTSMDEEIQALETEKDKMVQIREGAMDDLLTGRVRLKI